MKLLTGLFRSVRKKLQLTHDNDVGAFRETLNALVEQKDSLSDDEIQSKIDELKSNIEDLPDGDDKSKLERFLEDFKNVKEQDSNVAKKAASEVADLFEKLDTSAMQDTPDAVGNEADAPEDTDEVVEKAKEEETEDEDAEPQNPSLEEIYQFIKKRMEEDAGNAEDEACAEESEETEDAEEETEDGDEEESDKEVVEDEDEENTDEPEDETEDGDEEKSDEEVVTDHAPRIPIRMTKNNAYKGGLYAMFEKIKKGAR